MKTRYFIIVLGIIIAISVIFALTLKILLDDDPQISFESPFREEYYEIQITGLKDVYSIGEKYSFSVIFSGYGTGCFSYDVTYPINSTDSTTVATERSCISDAPLRDFVWDLKKDEGRSYGHITLDDPGKYTVRVSIDSGQLFDSAVSEFTFLVEESIDNKQKPLPKPETKNIIIISDKIPQRNIVPITITEMTTSIRPIDEVTSWGFSLLNIEMSTLGKYWGNLPDQYMKFEIIDEDGNDLVDESRLPEGGIWYPGDEHLYHLLCENDEKIVGASHHPSPIPIIPSAVIFDSSTNYGIYPDDNGQYKIEYVSLFETVIEFPEHVEIISYDSQLCKLEQSIQDDPNRLYTKGYYTTAIFRLDD